MAGIELTVALAQIDLLVGDVPGNRDKILATASRARDDLGAHVIVFPELTLTGYPLEDLLWRPGLQSNVERALQKLTQEITGIDVVIGFPRRDNGRLYNSAALIREREIVAVYDKQELPNYAVFDEKRYFTPGDQPCVVDIRGYKVAMTICEDIWYATPAQQAKAAGAELIFNLNASPFHVGKIESRERTVFERVHETQLPVVYVNLLGGQDELVFDGGSFAVDAAGRTVRRMPAFVEAVECITIGRDENARVQIPLQGCVPVIDRVKAVYEALVLGVRDYVGKNGFKGAVIGLSGGVDSALTLAVAVDALGAENVEAVMLPSRYTRDISLEDAHELAVNLGVEYRVISIENAFRAFLQTLHSEFAGMPVDVTEENIQARCRGVILMAISNKKGKIVLTTGNKSEMAMGYSTLYGDMAGGFNVLKDVPKTLVYELCFFRNRRSADIPERIIERPPSAELRADQTDQDSLPPYSVLDAILERYVERDMAIRDIINEGFDEEIVRRVIWLLDKNEYKRRQAPPGVKITPRAFGKDRRYPITSGYSEIDN